VPTVERSRRADRRGNYGMGVRGHERVYESNDKSSSDALSCVGLVTSTEVKLRGGWVGVGCPTNLERSVYVRRCEAVRGDDKLE
jgi:hypothetical protein